MRKNLCILICVFCFVGLWGCSSANNNISNADNSNKKMNEQDVGNYSSYYAVDGYEKSMDDLEDEYEYYCDNYDEIVKAYYTPKDNKDFIISKYKDGVEINKYLGNNQDLIIPGKLDGKKVLRLGSYLYKEKTGNSGEDKICRSIWLYKDKGKKTKIKTIEFPEHLQMISADSEDSWYGNNESWYYDYGTNPSLEYIKVHKNNRYYSSENGLLYNKDKSVLLYVPANHKAKTISVNENTEKALQLMSKNTVTVKIPEKLTDFCEKGKPDKLAYIDSVDEYENISHFASYSNEFQNATELYADKLESFMVDKNNKKYSSEDGVLYNKNKTVLLAYPSNKKDNTYKMPDSVTTVSHILLNAIKNLETIEFSENIKTINAFSEVVEVNKYDEDIPPKLSINTIKGYKGTTAEKYAKKHKFKFVPI